ncbi:uncharacterized protein [Diabrotica undecimpunctata]|uniref:uncharacterized protein n=1 Tax=Diabrotica undecimpunctata TaxID=50387 RepID=UPI003B63AA35
MFSDASNNDSESERDPFENSSESFVPSDSELSSDEDQIMEEPLEQHREELAQQNNKTKKRKQGNKFLWKRSIVKRNRLSGKKYINRSGKTVEEKKPLPVNCTKCRYKCEKNITEELRIIICREYWEMGDYDKQKLHLSSLVTDVPIKRRKQQVEQSRRKTSRIFYLKNFEGLRIRVCLNFFCKTFNISHRVIETCMKNVGNTHTYTGFDKRKGKRPHNVTKEQDVLLVKEHIDSFPRVESHYCRRDSTKQYLSSDLNLSQMYRLYIGFCENRNVTKVSKFVYQKIFHKYDPALDFFIPKKDQCFKCNAYNTAKDKEPLKEEFDSHKKREKDAMQMKSEDKERAAREKGQTFRAATFDLQAILSVPFAGDNQIFYKLKLNVYNFTIFDASDATGHCYVWDETHGKKGSTEIGTCLLKYLYSLSETVTHVSTFSDTCGGQNRNKYVSAALLYAVNTIKHLEVFDLKFMETGHSYLEADSMHATIERARKHKKIYSTREWSVLISAARVKPKPYCVHNLNFNDFYDLQKLADLMTPNNTLNTDKEKVQWLKIKWIRFEKKDPFLIKYKYNLYDDTFLTIDVSDTRKLRGRSQTWESLALTQKYFHRLPVSQKKKKDLLSLLNCGIIPQDYAHFINDIPVTNETLLPDDNE